MKKIKIAILSGGPSSEHEVSLKSAANVLNNIDREKYEIVEVFISKENVWLIEGNKFTEDNAILCLKDNGIDLALIILHGAYGEDGKLQAKFEEAGIKFTGSGSKSSQLAMDKDKSSKVLIDSGLKVPNYYVIEKEELERKLSLLDGFKPPVVVKPNDGGSSVGTTIVREESKFADALNESFKHTETTMVQEFISGREITCGVIETHEGLLPLVPTEIIPNPDLPFFDYQAKYTKGASQEITPPNLSKSIITEIQKQAIKAHKALKCRHFSRTDFILSDSTLYVLEVNTIPGMTETSLLPQGAATAGISFSELLDIVIEKALN